MNPGQHAAARLARRALGLLVAPLALLAQQQSGGRVAVPSDIAAYAIDPCGMAGAGDFAFLMGAGIGRYFPVISDPVTPDSVRVVVSEAALTGATCSPLRAELRARVQLVTAARERHDWVGTARFVARMSSKASFRVADPNSGHTPAALRDASLCFHDARVVALDLARGAPPVDPAWLGRWLGDALARRECFDVTSLVYRFLQRGGSLPPAP